MPTTTAGQGFNAGLLMQVQELVHVGAWTWDIRSDTVLWSDELFRLFGLEPQSIPLDLGSYMSRVHAADRGWVGDVVSEALAEAKPFQFDYRVLLPDGTIGHQHGRGSVMCDDLGNVVRMVGTVIDISDRIFQEQTMRISEERFRSLFEQSAVGMTIADGDGRLIRVNRSFEEFLGYSRDELCGMAFVDLTHPADVDRTLRMMSDNESPVARTFEKRYLRKDGTIVWARATVSMLRAAGGARDGYMAVIEDITDRMTATAAMTQQTELLQTIMSNLPVMVAMFDGQGNPLYVNREWQRVFGWTLEEARSIDLIGAIYPEAREERRARDAQRAGTKSWIDFESRTRDGRVIQGSWASVALSNGTTLSIGQDTTERIRLRQLVLKSQEMEELVQLAGGVAHDFNNLLTIISANATFLMDAVKGNQAATTDVQEVVTATRRAALLSKQLQGLSRRQSVDTPKLVTPRVRQIA